MFWHFLEIDELRMCVVGWDHGLGTFFAGVDKKQNYRGDPRDSGSELRIGTTRSEIADIEELKKKLVPYIKIPPATVAALDDENYP